MQEWNIHRNAVSHAWLRSSRSVPLYSQESRKLAKLADCGNAFTGNVSEPSTDCSMACTGNANEPCGGPNRLNIFWSGATPPPPPTTNPGPLGWKFLGCYAYVYHIIYPAFNIDTIFWHIMRITMSFSTHICNCVYRHLYCTIYIASLILSGAFRGQPRLL
jgi:hypothetical protein